ncbi:putative hemolysin [Neisseria iguanae]|uniref:DUF333 domain-containing protein n=1 Tax=Neisseria iguanae TaxID=90242 RepID=A0A2P7U0Z4_9NEIS|nr:DUF333 domain-containing protein [Neisseria iguanae]PSJ80637.1 DUF333 domain-containing protein [Neisseria iguanae]
MLKIFMMAAMAAAALTACTQNAQPKPFMKGMANPASEFCVKQGGKSVIRKDARGGEYGECHLPDGTVAEEWAYFRRYNQ